jgi:hypothetical protein
MLNELKIISSYIVAVCRQWWVVVVEILLVLTDVFERIFGTWLLPSTRIKLGIGFAALLVAQYRAYREAVSRSIELESQKVSLESQKVALQDQQRSQTMRDWRPKAWIESEPLQNYLILKSDLEFLLDSVALKFSNGAVAIRIENRERVSSTGFRFPIPGDRLTKDLWNVGAKNGSIEAVVIQDGHTTTVEVPFVAIQSMDRNTFWIRLQG